MHMLVKGPKIYGEEISFFENEEKQIKQIEHLSGNRQVRNQLN